jgi:hypothetical protein
LIRPPGSTGFVASSFAAIGLPKSLIKARYAPLDQPLKHGEHMGRTYTAFLDNKQLKITNEALSDFANAIGISITYMHRVSELFLFDLFIYDGGRGDAGDALNL